METTIHTAFAKAQSEFPKISKDATNPFFKNKYVSLDNILEVVLPVLHSNGLYLTQSPVSNHAEGVGVHTSIVHAETGDMIQGSFMLPLAKNDPQGAGAAVSYARRYSLQSILGLNFEEDDDANRASGNKTKGASPSEETINY